MLGPIGPAFFAGPQTVDTHSAATARPSLKEEISKYTSINNCTLASLTSGPASPFQAIAGSLFCVAFPFLVSGVTAPGGGKGETDWKAELKSALMELFPMGKDRQIFEVNSRVTVDAMLRWIDESQSMEELQRTRFFRVLYQYYLETAKAFAANIAPSSTRTGPVSLFLAGYSTLKEMAARLEFLANVFERTAVLKDGLIGEFSEVTAYVNNVLRKYQMSGFEAEIRSFDLWFQQIGALTVEGFLGAGRTLSELKIQEGFDRLNRLHDELNKYEGLFLNPSAGNIGTKYAIARIIVHDFNGVMTALIGNHDLAVIHFENGNTQKGIESLRRLFKAASQYQPLSLAMENPSRLIPEMLMVINRKRSVSEVMNDDAKMFFNKIAPPWLYRVMANLFQNAVRASARSIRMDVIDAPPLSAPERVRQEPQSYTIIAVKDDGGGIPSDVAARIFKEKVHGDPTKPGSGEYLLRAFQLLTRFNAFIWFDTVVGQGTTFYLAIPKKGDISGGGSDGGNLVEAEEPAPLGGYAADIQRPTQALSLGARRMLEKRGGVGSSVPRTWLVPAYGASQVFIPSPVLIAP